MPNFLIDNITFISLDQQQLTEAKLVAENSGMNGLLIRDVLLQECDTKNQNGRVYPQPILEREVKKYTDNFINQKAAYGELDHPETPTIRLKEVSHIIPRVHWSGNKLLGDINVLDTPNGRIAESILRAGGRIGVSSRALGSTKKVQNDIGEEYDKVEEDLELCGWDLVSNPSVLKASFMLHEGLDKNLEILNRYKKIAYLINKILDL